LGKILDYSALGLTSAPKIDIMTFNGEVSSTLSTVTATGCNVYLWDTAASGSYQQEAFQIGIKKSGADARAPGVYVGTVAKTQVQIVDISVAPGTTGSVGISASASPGDTIPIIGSHGDIFVTADTVLDRYTFPAGDYLIEADVSGTKGDWIYTEFFNFTDSLLLRTSSIITHSTNQGGMRSGLKYRFSITEPKTYELRVYSSGTAPNYMLNGTMVITKLR